MGATLIMVVSLAIVLALIVVLLAKLYCFCLTPLAVTKHKPPHQFGILSPVSPSTSLATSPNPVQEISTRIGTGTTTNCKEKLTILRLRGLGNNGSSGDDEKAEPWTTSPSSPMKNLPAQACPVSLRDA
ncbi:hypothetical protein Golax_006977, partial [Gossypium laxum]|nr:hypothetical protein [Gossypium laxum]